VRAGIYNLIKNLFFKGVENMEAVLETSFQAKGQLGEVLSSCELMDAECAEAVVQNMGLKLPLGAMPFYMLLETSGSNATHDEEKLNKFLEDVMGKGLVADGTVVTEPSRIKVNYTPNFIRRGIFNFYIKRFDMFRFLKNLWFF
jgi:FAD/FMN-containing dehydrogenase